MAKIYRIMEVCVIDLGKEDKHESRILRFLQRGFTIFKYVFIVYPGKVEQRYAVRKRFAPILWNCKDF